MISASSITCALVVSAAQPVAGILPAGAIEITPAADHIVLGEAEALTLRVRVYDAAGRPQDQRPPTLLVSIGEVGPARRVAPGVFEVRYTPPAAGPPRVAIVLARVRTAAGLIAGWCRIPLWGRGEVTVETKPAAQVLLRIGDQAFGPVESDGAGRASLPIVVPPGPRHGVAETVDRAGNTSKKTIDLGIRPFDRLAAFALDDDVVADGSEPSGVLAFAVDGRGVPLVDAPLQSQAARGQIGETLPLAPGVYRIAYRAPSGVGEGVDTVAVELQHDRVSRVQVSIPLSPGDPQVIQLAVEPARYLAGSGDVPRLTLRALDAAGNLAPPSLIDIEVEGGVLGVAAPDGRGGVQIPVEVGDRFEGRRTATIHARARRGAAVATATIELVAGPCANVDLDGPSHLLGDGRQQTYTVRCLDRFGNAAACTAPRVSGSPLVVEAVKAKDPSALQVVVRTPVLSRPQVAALTVRADGVAGALRVELEPSVWLQAFAGPRVVAGWAYGPTWLAGGALDWHLAIPLLGDSLLVGASAAALSSPPLAVAVADDVTLRRLQLYPLLAEVGYQLHLAPRLVGRASVGLGPVLGAPTLDRNGRSLDHELAVALLAEAGVGLGVELGRGVVEASARGGYGLSLRAVDGVDQLGGLWGGLGYRVPF